MIRRLIFPDPLVWQSGLEWGIEAFAMLVDEGHDLRCCLRAEGPMFEAIAFAALDLGVLDRCTFANDASELRSATDVVVYCRVDLLDTSTTTNSDDDLPILVSSIMSLPTSNGVSQQVPTRNSCAIAAAVRGLLRI